MIFAIVATVLALLLVALLLPCAPRLRLVDFPGGRKRHSGAVPLVGGLAIYGSLLVVAIGCPIRSAPGSVTFVVLAGMAAVAGLLDDRYRLPPVAKLALQFAIAAAAVFWADRIVGDAGSVFRFEIVAPDLFAAAFSILLYVTLMNAINLIDGADGVAGGVALVALVGLGVIGAEWQIGTNGLVWIELGAIGGFLVYNAPLPWRRPIVFLGDSGSMVIGFSLAWFSIGLHQRAPQVSSVTLAWVLAMPVIDMGRVTLSRLRRGVSPFTAGRDHLHHLLLDRGMSRSMTALTILALAALFAAIGIAGARLGVRDATLAGMLCAATLVYGGVIGVLRASGVIGPHLPVAAAVWRPSTSDRAPEDRRKQERRSNPA